MLPFKSTARSLAVLAALSASSAIVSAETSGFVPPPRTISDITALLDQEKPDPSEVEKLNQTADAAAPPDADELKLFQFLYRRGQARIALGRCEKGIADVERAIELKRRRDPNVHLMERYLVGTFSSQNCSDLPRALRLLAEMAKSYDRNSHAPGVYYLVNINRFTIDFLAGSGRLAEADLLLAKTIDLQTAVRDEPSYELYHTAIESEVEFARAVIHFWRGQYAQAETALLKSVRARRDARQKSVKWPERPPESRVKQIIDWSEGMAAISKREQGRIAEAEADMRRVLLNRLRSSGKYHASTAQAVRWLGGVLYAQGRYEEAEKLFRIAVEILESVGLSPRSESRVMAGERLAAILQMRGRWAESAQIYLQLEKMTETWTPEARNVRLLTPSRIDALFNSGELEKGIETARSLVALERERAGERHLNFGIAKGLLAVGLARNGRDAEALTEFGDAIPILISTSRAQDDDEATPTAARDRTVSSIVETYIAVLARSPKRGAAASEGFALAEAIRGRAVQKALLASSARIVVRDPALAELVRREQDLGKQIGAQFGLLSNVLALPPSQRDEAAVMAIRDGIERMRQDHQKLRVEIAERFPDYQSLVDPKPPTVPEIQQILKADEALVSFHFGMDRSFVWAVGKTGPPAFAVIATTGAQIDEKVAHLRRALEPNATTVGDIPPFDLDAAHELYNRLLRPVEPALMPARHLILITNGSLALMPLGLLPTARTALKPDPALPFAEYRAVPWLVRTHSVTLVPSAAALRTLRQLPAGAPNRETFVGFGDPFFNAEQAADAERPTNGTQSAAVAFRSLPLNRRAVPKTTSVDSAELGLLPRLPDTADELKSVALGLRADQARAVHLGKSANEALVKGTDLSRVRIVAFATHGLVPGDLNGLTQPALALTAPKVAGVDGDGLLTMEEILALKLDADWVLLSACNTGAGSEAGAGAASGLARAFFYAGTRAVLVTNWSVHSDAARELVTELFRRQASSAATTRGEALRESMVALLDGGGYRDQSGKTIFAYAHPLFWAAYTIIGDGGANR